MVLPRGLAIVDTGAAQDLIGLSAFKALRQAWARKGLRPVRLPKAPQAASGIGGQATALFVVLMPVFFAGVGGTVEMTVLSADIPHLISAPFLTYLKAVVDMSANVLHLGTIQRSLKMTEGQGGHRLVNVVDVDGEVHLTLNDSLCEKYGLHPHCLEVPKKGKTRSQLLAISSPGSLPRRKSESLQINGHGSSSVSLAPSGPQGDGQPPGQLDARPVLACVQKRDDGEYLGHRLHSSSNQKGSQSVCHMGDMPRLPGSSCIPSQSKSKGGWQAEDQEEGGGEQGRESRDHSDSSTTSLFILRGQSGSAGLHANPQGPERRALWGDEAHEDRAGRAGVEGQSDGASHQCSSTDDGYWGGINTPVHTDDTKSDSAGGNSIHLLRRRHAAGGLRCNSAASSASPEPTLDRVAIQVREMLDLHVPRHYSRTNLKGTAPRSILLGAYTRRGSGITKATQRLERFLPGIHAIARLRPQLTEYMSIMLNEVVESSGLSIHRDLNNAPVESWLISCGQHEGGLLWVEDEKGMEPPPRECLDHLSQTEQEQFRIMRGRLLNPKGTWVSFNPKRWHAVTAVRGDRLSISLFSPSFPQKLTESQWRQLLEAGFPCKKMAEQCIGHSLPGTVPTTIPSLLAAGWLDGDLREVTIPARHRRSALQHVHDILLDRVQPSTTIDSLIHVNEEAKQAPSGGELSGGPLQCVVSLDLYQRGMG